VSGDPGAAGAADAAGAGADAEATRAAQAALGRAEAGGISRIPVPTPFRVGPINVYLIEDEPLTLIDAGPNSATSFDVLEAGLAERGRAVADVELLVLTHQHPDHQGLAASIVRRSGADVAALDRLAGPLADWAGYADRNDEFAEGLMRRHGIAPEMTNVLRAVARAQHGWGASVTTTRPLVPGERLVLRDRSLQILHSPGHSPSDTLFWDEERDILIGGDHLLGHISSNPIITLPLDDDEAARALAGEDRPHPLPDYLASLRRTRDLGPGLVLPGHGDPVTDARALVEQRLVMHRRRADKIHGILTARARTAHEVAREMWGDRALSQPILTLSEVLGHIDLLAAEGRAREVDEGGRVRLEAV
jgi:glyoxylase-like metal-dependent hydrolase (beta-lactamase superfamily II)